MGLVVASGFGIVAASQILMVLLLKGGGHSYAADILPAWFLIGIGFGFSLPTIIGSATTDLPAKLSATGSAVVNSGRQVGGRLRHRHPRRDPRQGSHDRRPDAVLPLVVGSGRHLRRCRRDLPRPHAPSPDRGGAGDCR